MQERIIFSGFGGQGVLTIGKMVAAVGVNTVEYVTCFPSYGTEVRGGTANCQVILSDEEIASPVVEQADSAILMNQPSLERFLPRLGNEGRAWVNTSLAEAPGDDSRVVAIPATDMASELGDVRAANVILLGSYLRAQDWSHKELFLNALEKKFSSTAKDVIELNHRAFELGWRFSMEKATKA